MKVKKAKKQIKTNSGLQKAIDNAHDVALFEHCIELMLFHALNCDKNKKVTIPERPFANDRINDAFEFLYSAIKSLKQQPTKTQTQ